MGGFISRVRRLFISKREVRMLMNGLDAAGKTTILYKLKLGEVVTTIPTIGFNVETVEYRNIAFTVWDVGGRDKIRPLWRHYYQNTNALIWVIDSNDRDRLDSEDYGSTTKDELHKALSEDELRDAPLLVFANKQDLPNAMKVQEITERLGLNKLRNRQWFIQGCCATSGDGLYEGLEWLSDAVKRQVVTPSQRNQYTAPIPVAAPVYVPPIEPLPRKLGALGVMDAISSANPNAFAVHALDPVPAPAPAAAASAKASAVSAPSTPPLLAIMPPASYWNETVNGVPRAPPMTVASSSAARRFVAPRASSTAPTAAPAVASARAPVSSRLFPSFPRTAEEDAQIQATTASLVSMLNRNAEANALEPGSSELIVKQLDSGEVSVAIVKKQQQQQQPSFDLKHSPLVSLQVRYPVSELAHPLSKSQSLLNELTLDSPPSTPPRKRSAVVGDSEFVIVERIEEEEDLVVVPHAQPGENHVRLAMVEC